jgi:hypothetical protein
MSVALARKYQVQVSTDNVSWLNLGAVDDFNAAENATLQGADTYDTNGFNSFEKTLTGWKVTLKFLRRQTGGTYDAAQEVLRATRFQFGTAARVYVRWYDKGGSADAYSGQAIVDWNPSKTAVADIEEITTTLTGDGIVAAITNPYNVAVVPVVTSASPSGQGTGTSVAIYGQNFTGVVATTGVKFGGINATSFTFQNDGLITAVLPSSTAGLVTILVTNATGASVQINNYTRAA